MFKHIILIVLIFSTQDFFTQNSKSRKRTSTTLVSLQITQTSMWCGGARPSEEMEKEFNTPRPYPNLTLYIRKDTNAISRPVLYTITTDDAGKASIKLPPGKYVVVNIEKKDDSVYNATISKYKDATETTGPIDINCYKIFMAEPDFTIVVSKLRPRNVRVTHNYRKHCNWSGAPCVEFRGHYPP
ncbi:MAG: hypothetical protein JNL75_00695 [Chitinophagales bacterium]|nr:hypothetical protein [Chitinophagales bacterium]